MAAAATEVQEVVVAVEEGGVPVEEEVAPVKEEVEAVSVEAHGPRILICGVPLRNWLSFLAYVLNTVVTFGSLFGIFGPTNGELSLKYQTLVTPAGYAFSIWGVIFASEGLWAVLQLCPFFAFRLGVRLAAPGWWAACLFQCLWTIAFAQEVIWLSLILISGILGSLLFVVLRLDALRLGWCDYLLQRAPFAVHLGWLVCATAVNWNVFLDSLKAQPDILLAAAAITIAVLVIVSAVFATCLRMPEPIVALVAAWALVAIAVELADGTPLNDPTRFNPYMWEESTLQSLQSAAIVAASLCGGLAILALVLRCCGCSVRCYRCFRRKADGVRPRKASTE